MCSGNRKVAGSNPARSTKFLGGSYKKIAEEAETRRIQNSVPTHAIMLVNPLPHDAKPSHGFVAPNPWG